METTSEHGNPAAIPFARHAELQRWGSFFESEAAEIQAIADEDRNACALMEAQDMAAEGLSDDDYDDLREDRRYREAHPWQPSEEAKQIAWDAMQRAMAAAGIG
ncbi:MAG: hypothetical protein WC829_02710 [Hyphomicrobium sp.]|jgi:hypothetical protein